MKNVVKIFSVILLLTAAHFPQGFKVKATGEQNFSFYDKVGRNQASFFSTTPLEDITGLSNDINGSVTFNVDDITTLKGSISISTASIKTGIELRDTHLRSPNWLDADQYPEISFAIKKVNDVTLESDSKINAKVTGDFTTHGITKEIVADVSMTYLDESESTKQRSPGDLLGVEAKFNITLSDFGVENMLLGQKVSEKIEIMVTLVGSNAQ
ncbi:MAG: YceI family protein [Ignavibacteria bacterium]|jgi:polyisoprenoid-binding protein YceI